MCYNKENSETNYLGNSSSFPDFMKEDPIIVGPKIFPSKELDQLLTDEFLKIRQTKINKVKMVKKIKYFPEDIVKLVEINCRQQGVKFDVEASIEEAFNPYITDQGIEFWEDVVNSMGHDTIVAEVRDDLMARSVRGFKKYKTTLDRKDIDLKGWLNHQYEELLDGALYAKRAIRELEEKEKEWKPTGTLYVAGFDPAQENNEVTMYKKVSIKPERLSVEDLIARD